MGNGMICTIKGKGQRGATVVEFAVVVPLLLAVLFGILEFSFLFLQRHYVANAAREGVRIGVRAQNYNCFDASDTSEQCTEALVKVYRAGTITSRLTDCTTSPKGYLCTLYQREITNGTGEVAVQVTADQPIGGNRKMLRVSVTAPNFFPQLITWIVPIYSYPTSFTYTSSGYYEDASEP